MRITDPKTGESMVRKRRKRFHQEGEARELTFTCFHHYRFLDRDRTRQWFIEALREARQKWQFDLWAYVIMPEHVHLLIYPRVWLARPESVRDAGDEGEGEGTIEGILGDVKEPVARKAIKFLKQHAPEWLPRITVREGKRVRRRFWQPGGGYDRNVVELATVHRMIEYIHANPVRRGLVRRPEDWEWSGARWYAGIRPVLIEMDRTIPMDLDGKL